MKCDELKPIFIPIRGITGDTLLGVGYYPSNVVDEAIAELKCELSDARDDARSSRNLIDDKNEEIKELEDKVQQKDFFWDGCGFSKMGFKNTIDVANYVDSLKAVNESLRKAVSNWHDKYCNLQETIDRLECKLECVKADKDKELRATKRALWMARANYCHNFRIDWYIRLHPGTKMTQSTMENILIVAELKCRDKAKEYK